MNKTAWILGAILAVVIFGAGFFVAKNIYQSVKEEPAQKVRVEIGDSKTKKPITRIITSENDTLLIQEDTLINLGQQKFNVGASTISDSTPYHVETPIPPTSYYFTSIDDTVLVVAMLLQNDTIVIDTPSIVIHKSVEFFKGNFRNFNVSIDAFVVAVPPRPTQERVVMREHWLSLQTMMGTDFNRIYATWVAGVGDWRLSQTIGRDRKPIWQIGKQWGIF